MRQDTTESDGGADQRIQLFVTANGELEMTRRDTLDFEILGSIASEFEYFGSQVLEDGCDVDSGCSGSAEVWR